MQRIGNNTQSNQLLLTTPIPWDTLGSLQKLWTRSGTALDTLCSSFGRARTRGRLRNMPGVDSASLNRAALSCIKVLRCVVWYSAALHCIALPCTAVYAHRACVCVWYGSVYCGMVWCHKAIPVDHTEPLLPWCTTSGADRTIVKRLRPDIGTA